MKFDLLLICRVSAALIPALPAAQPQAQNYPAHGIRLVAPFTPGSPVDLLGRMLAGKLSESWRQPVIVDNRPGAGGTIGTAYVATSAPDGYTLLIGSVGSLGTASGLYKNLAYDPIKDFSALTLAVRSASVLLVHPSLPVRTVKEMIALAKLHPGRLNYSSGGNGTPGHLAMELLNTMAGIKIVHIPYRGPEDALNQLVAGQVEVAVQSAVTALPFMRSGRLKGIATTSREPLREIPNLPTISDAALPGFAVYVWYGLLAPAGTPVAIVNKLNYEIVRILNLPDIIARVQAQGGEVATGSPEEFADFIRTEVDKWSRVIKASNARID